MKESRLEHNCNRYARKKYGITTRKMNGLGFAGWPDRVYPLPNERILWVEFKKPGKLARAKRKGERPTTDGQHGVHKLLKKMGQNVKVIDDERIFRGILDKAYAAAVEAGG